MAVFDTTTPSTAETLTGTPSLTATTTVTPSTTVTQTSTPTTTETPSHTPSLTATVTVTPSSTDTPTDAPSVTATLTHTPTITDTLTSTPSVTATLTGTSSTTATVTNTPSTTTSSPTIIQPPDEVLTGESLTSAWEELFVGNPEPAKVLSCEADHVSIEEAAAALATILVEDGIDITISCEVDGDEAICDLTIHIEIEGQEPIEESQGITSQIVDGKICGEFE